MDLSRSYLHSCKEGKFSDDIIVRHMAYLQSIERYYCQSPFFCSHDAILFGGMTKSITSENLSPLALYPCVQSYKLMNS